LAYFVCFLFLSFRGQVCYVYFCGVSLYTFLDSFYVAKNYALLCIGVLLVGRKCYLHTSTICQLLVHTSLYVERYTVCRAYFIIEVCVERRMLSLYIKNVYLSGWHYRFPPRIAARYVSLQNGFLLQKNTRRLIFFFRQRRNMSTSV